MKKITGAEIVIQTLIEEKVDVIFGYPGGAVLPIYDELFKTKKIRHILVRHEQAAVHAAEVMHAQLEKLELYCYFGPGN